MFSVLFVSFRLPLFICIKSLGRPLVLPSSQGGYQMATLRASVERVASAYRMRLKQMTDLQQKVKTFQFSNSYYNQLGLLYHDVIPHSPLIAEAVRRLPREETEARDFRIARAFQLSASKTVLPKEQWTAVEDDIPYLDPYIEVAKKEWKEKAEWDHFVNPETYP
ncbi:Ubiquinol-cytochrome c reductase subunit 7 [Fasciola gigantica]|uniref:Cytochrome b-c1 complex subunit 7 n=1 Tax=Fasciola gigantica TaxID=46835 RepID=A0A504YTX7_FASGI|nr:Ubiquinol-cytochrome c reductase subunit 7 [Fasciola gigantica]